MTKRDAGRAAPARQTGRGMLTREELIAMIRDCRARAQDGLADLPEDGREYASRTRDIGNYDKLLSQMGA